MSTYDCNLAIAMLILPVLQKKRQAVIAQKRHNYAVFGHLQPVKIAKTEEDCNLAKPYNQIATLQSKEVKQ